MSVRSLLVRLFLSGTVVAAVVAGVVAPTGAAPARPADVSAPADVTRIADQAFDAWNASFLVHDGGTAYYTDHLKSRSTDPQRFFTQALDIAVAEDVYQRRHRPDDRRLVLDLVQTFIGREGTDWGYNSWNDDIAWMTLAVLRGYQSSGNAAWLDIAKRNWDMAYNRGWSSPGGGGLWEDNNRHDRGKCALSNNPMVTAGVQIYLTTGDGAYLDKSRAIYNWVRRTLVDTSSGKVNGCTFFRNGENAPGTVDSSDNVYDAGSFIEAANLLYRVSGDRSYFDDAVRSADHIKNTVPIIHQNQGRGSSYQYRYFRGLTEFCTDNGICDRYRDYILANANSAWNNRNSAGLMWNEWTQPTASPDPDAFEMASGPAIWQQVPLLSGPDLGGTYQIRSAASNQLLAISNSSTTQGAAVVQTADAGDPSALWTFSAASNGHVRIVNVRSGQALNVAGASSALNTAVVQWPQQSDREANDKWLPVRNDDGTWTFVNRSSQFVLDDPGASTAAGTAYIQWSPNEGAQQKFMLVRR